MKRRPLKKLLALSVSAALLAGSLAGCGETDADAIDPAYVAQLEQECVELRNQLEELRSQITDLEQTVVLKSYALKAVPREDNSGAVIAITAVPMRYEEGQTASFCVTLDGSEVTTVQGTWDGTAYVAEADLDAADGYSYECILTKADGTENKIVISSPEAPLYEACVHLQTALSAYCNLIVGEASQDGNVLVLDTAFVQVQLPRIGGRAVTCSTSDLVLRMGEEELQRVPLQIPPGETDGSYELMLADVRFPVPDEMGDQSLELWLEVALSDGQTLSYNGCSWSLHDGVLALAAG